MSMPNNEGKACDAVLRMLESRIGAADIRYPERDHVGPPVDLRFKLAGQEYAIEHSLIEAMPEQTHTAVEFARFIIPVTEVLSGTLPGPAVYNLYFPFNARLGVPPDQLENIRRDFVAWVREKAQALDEKNPQKPTREKNPRGFTDQYRGTPPGFSYEVTLRRESHWSMSGAHDGVLLAARIAPDDVEAQHVEHLRTALDRKCPTLHECKDEGARTVLVLEDNNIALSNHVQIEDSLSGLFKERNDLPDEIYFVESSINTWSVRIIKIDDAFFPEQDWTDFESAVLADLTRHTTDSPIMPDSRTSQRSAYSYVISSSPLLFFRFLGLCYTSISTPAQFI